MHKHAHRVLDKIALLRTLRSLVLQRTLKTKHGLVHEVKVDRFLLIAKHATNAVVDLSQERYNLGEQF